MVWSYFLTGPPRLICWCTAIWHVSRHTPTPFWVVWKPPCPLHYDRFQAQPTILQNWFICWLGRPTYKIKHELVHIPCDAYYTKVTRTTRSSYAGSFLCPIATTDYYRYSFFPHSTVLWGSLSDAIIASPSLDSFTAALKWSLCSKSLQHVVVSKVVATLCSSYF